MIFIKDGQVEWHLKWFHQPDRTETLISFQDGKKVETPVKGVTTCSVFMIDGSEPLEYLGQAYCSVKDEYNKEKGRKISLTKAVENLPKETRKIIWEGYFSRKN